MHAKKIAVALASVVALGLPATAAADYAHITQPGESLTSIAADDGLSVQALAAANGLSTQSELQVGQVVEIPPLDTQTAAGTGRAVATAGQRSSAATTTYVSDSAGRSGGYVVQPGDTLSAIAARIGTSVAELAGLNGLNANGILLAGRTLTLPGGSSSAAATSAPATGAGNQQIAGDTSGGPYPTDQYVSASQVGGEAADDGVSSSLAEAIGWQESGYDNDLVSSTGAVGVMQIEPATWAFINQVLTPGDPLSPSSAYDNVAGGVLLLRDLVAQTGSDTLATAAYYQGLESVEQHGMYASTQQYVRDVSALQERFGG